MENNMRTAFQFILIIHGLIHLMGFVKAFDLVEMVQFTKENSKPKGLLF